MLSKTLNSLCVSGLDVSKALQVGWYNQSVAPEHRLPHLGSSDGLALLIGNSKRIWLPFLAWLAGDRLRLESCNPLETYVETVIGQAFSEFDAAHRVRFSHRPEPHHIAFQQLAEIAGLALPGHHDVAASWQDWLAIRDACPIGRGYRYSDDQIRYHYIKDRSFLRTLVDTAAR